MKVLFRPSNFDKANLYKIDDEPSVIFVQDLLAKINNRIVKKGARYKRYDANVKRWYE